MSRANPVDANERAFWEKADRLKEIGLGFWRLVWIVAFGILISQAISGALIGLWTALRR